MTGVGRAAGDGVPQAERVKFLFDPATTLATLVGQRRRFATAVAQLGPDELASPSRCTAWSVADVLRHGLWADEALRATWVGDRSLVEGFDPRFTPDEFVRRERAVPDAEVVARYCTSSARMADSLACAGPEDFAAPALSPLGDVPWWLGGVHLGWDAWIHERDVLVPLGRATNPQPSETVPVLAYGLVLASFFAGREPLSLQVGPVRLHRGGGVTEAWAMGQEDERAADDVAQLVGDPAAVVDGLSGRGALDGVLEGPPDVVTRLGGMARYFTSDT